MLVLDIAGAFSYEKNDGFWLEDGFREAVYETTERYFNSAIEDTGMIIDQWGNIIESARKNGVPVRKI